MLNIQFLKSENTNVYTDAEEEFNRIVVDDTETNRRLMEEIDEATYLDTNYFIDRFGAKLPIGFLSTGCKAALVIEYWASHKINKVFDTVECGINAKNAIIKNCKNGNIYMRELGSTVTTNNNTCIDVGIGKYKFTNVDRLNHYIFDEFMGEADMKIPGVEKLG